MFALAIFTIFMAHLDKPKRSPVVYHKLGQEV